MKRTIFIILTVLNGMSSLAQDRAALGLDISSILERGSISILASHGFSTRWSASFSAELKGWTGVGEISQEYEEHLAEFDDVPYRRKDTEACYRMSLQYWLNETYRGVFLGIGCRCAKGEDPDCSIDLGYSIPVRESIRLILNFGTDLIATSRNGKAVGQGLTLGLYWTIKTGRR